jgi:RNA polymerase-associated protein
MLIHLGHSPDPDDAFMFWGLASGEVDPRRLEFEHVLKDIQTLNTWALDGKLEVSAISLAAYPLVQEGYVLLPHGASRGSGYGPILVERDLILYESNIINEYIDERFPHPQLMPADPVMRARARLFLHRFEKELFVHIDALEGNNQKSAEKARGLVRDSLLQITPVFAKHKHMLGEDYSMLDVAITPLLWRLDYYGIQMGKQAAPLMKYAERLFARPAFSEALTSAERGMRK